VLEYKGYVIQRTKSLTMFEIKEPGLGGSLPEALKGLFTASTLATRAIDNYLDSKVKKVEKTNGGTSSDGTD
jgi:hypothetical protein